MGQEFRFLCPVETWRLLWLMGMVFSVIVTFQYFELPYGNVPSSMYTHHEVLVIAENNDSSVNAESPSSETVSNVTHFSGLNSASIYGGAQESENVNEREETGNVGDDVLSGEIVGTNKPVEIGDKEPTSGELVDLNMNRKLDPVNGSTDGVVQGAPELSQGNGSFPSENVGTVNANKSSTVPTLPRTDSSPNITFPNVNSNLESPFTPFDPNMSVFDYNVRESLGSSPSITSPRNIESDIVPPVVLVDPNTVAVNKDARPSLEHNGNSGEMQNNLPAAHSNTVVATVHKAKKRHKTPTSDVVTLSEMNNLLLQSWSSPNRFKPRRSSAIDRELLHAKSQIENSPISDNDPALYAPLYRNVSVFKRSYELMEEMLKVYVYKEGNKPIFHQPTLKGIYASEGWFMKLLETNRKYITKAPRKAHLFYLPFGSRNLEETLYVANSHSHKNLIQYLKDYVDMVAAKYPFWNRTKGADHFLVACHDWAPAETRHIMANCIRALCNSDVNEGFIFGKDVSLPETYVKFPQRPLRDLGGKSPSKRSILAFFAGNMHGYLRPILLQHWGNNKDPDMQIFGPIPSKGKGKMNYVRYMQSSKYCICAKGYEVNSPRVVEAIFYECVPVIISDNFVPPFFGVLNWESFSVFVLEKDIPNLKNILLSIPEKRYQEMQNMVKRAQQHFLWHPRPVKYDLFHMILHSVWYNRVFRM